MTTSESRGVTGQPTVAALWHKRSLTGKITLVVAAVMVIYHLLYVSQALGHLGIYIMTPSHRAASLGFMLVITFLTTRWKKGAQKKLSWFDILLILMSLVGTGYHALFYRVVLNHLQGGYATVADTVFFWLLLVAILEAGRRLMGWIFPAIAMLFIVHALFTSYFPGILGGRSFSMERLTRVFYLGDTGIFGTAMGVASTIIVAFIAFADLLRYSGAADLFLKLAMSLFGTVRGGPAKIAVFASALFATISGSPSANVAGTGSITIPLMKSVGYQPHFAAAVEAVASKGGQITPPVMGAVAFLMAELTGIGYLKVVIVAALPALLYFLAVYFQVDFRAAKQGMRGLSREQIPSFRKTMKEGWHYPVPLIALVVLMFQMKYQADMAAVYAILVLAAVTAFRRESRLDPPKLLQSFESTAKAMCTAGIACAMAGVVMGSLAGTGFGVTFSARLVSLAGGNLLVLLLLTAVACYVLGMGVSSIPIYIILATLVAPAMTKMGVPVEAAHLFVIYWGNIAFISPPVAVAVFVAASIANCDPMQAGWQAVRLAIVSFVVPFMFVYDPVLILIGTPLKIVLATVTSIIGVIALGAGLEGYLYRSTGWLERAGLLLGGFLLLFPDWRADMAGIGIAAAILLRQMTAVRIARRQELAGNSG